MEMKLEQILEALLLSASRPLSINEILAAFDKEKSPSKDEIREILFEEKRFLVLDDWFQGLRDGAYISERL